MNDTCAMNVLVTGCGGGVGQSIIKCFQESQYHVVGLDGEVLAAGLYAVPKAYQIPYAASPDYVSKLLDICRVEGPGLIFPGLDTELPVLAEAADLIRQTGVVPVVSSPEVVAICDEKLLTAQFLEQEGFPAPVTRPLSFDIVEAMHLPLILKPRKGGARSRGVFTVSDKKELDFLLSTLDVSNYVAQEYVTGDEYTCGTVTFDGICHGVIIMRRILRDGDTYKAFVSRDPKIENHVRAIVEKLAPFGPCNVQLRVRDGTPIVFELNARCSGTTYARALAGFNEPVMVANYLLKNEIPSTSIREVSILRYWKELLVENSAIASLQERGTREGGGQAL